MQQQQTRDAIKNLWCKNNHIPLIRIPYTAYNTLSLADLIPSKANTFVINTEDVDDNIVYAESSLQEACSTVIPFFGRRYIKRFDLAGNLIDSWFSADEAASALGLSTDYILKQCCNKQHIYKDMQFAFSDDDSVSAINKQHRYIEQYKDGILIHTYLSSKELQAAGYCSSTVYKVCKKQENRKTYKGYEWKFIYW